MPLATEVVSFDPADDELYIPVIKRIDSSLKKSGLLYSGDCKSSAFSIRLYIVGQEIYYLSPLPLTGHTATDMEDWITQGIEKDLNYELEFVYRQDEHGKDIMIAAGYECEREHFGVFEGKEIEWTERVLVKKSPVYAEQQAKGLEKRLKTAQKKIEALTPEIGRGKRQITDEQQLIAAIEKVIKTQGVEGLQDVKYDKEILSKTKFVGPGRCSKKRKKQVINKVRFSITSVTRNEEAIDNAKQRFGWRAFVTNKTKAQMSLSEAVISYRYEYRIERIFNRLKSELNIAPVFMKRKDQIIGLSHFLSLGVRVLSLVEFVVRRSLCNDKLEGLHPENRQKKTAKPTVKRLLSVFSNITLTIIIIKTFSGEFLRYLTPLSNLQTDILRRLGLDSSIYINLKINNSQNLLSEW